MVRSVTLALLCLTAFAAPLAAQAPAPRCATPAAPEPAAAADAAKDDGRQLGVLQRRPREDLHRHVPADPSHGRQEGRVRSAPAPASFRSFARSPAGAWPTTISFVCSMPRASRVLEFSEVESGIFEAPRPGEGILFIQNAVGARPGAARPPSRSTGEWTIARRTGRPICALTLSNTAAGDEFVVRVQPPCDAVVTRFGPATWQMDRGETGAASRRAASPGASRRAEDSKWRSAFPRPPIRCYGAEIERADLRAAQKLERMRDGRAVYIGAERVDDVTSHPAFREGARTIAGLYDLKADPEKRELFSFEEDGERYQPVLAALPQPRRSRAPHARAARRSRTRPTASSAARPIRCRA